MSFIAKLAAVSAELLLELSLKNAVLRPPFRKSGESGIFTERSAADAEELPVETVVD